MSLKSRPVRRILGACRRLRCWPQRCVAPAAQASPRSPHQPKTVQVRVIGFNDFHGNLEPPAGSSGG